MFNRLEQLTELIGGNKNIIDHWLKSHKALLISYYRLVGMKPNKKKHMVLDENALIEFGHNLVSYLSSGHFHIYDRIISRQKNTTELRLTNTHKIYPLLKDNTQKIMTFYDNYIEKGVNDEKVLQLHNDLSTVGELLEKRFTLEDRLIQEVSHSWTSIETAN